ncbi:hypothetical protein K438DRAFT_1775839 [Mycena galopus ATCC 62051]|nr:hypothetical protein K438DRAFT_1775839 [Mycena galopus ATCC 62051]
MARERMREFFRIQRESEYQARDQWARKEQRQHEQERARAEREEQDRQRWREQRRQHQEQQEEGARREHDNRQSDREQQRERAQNTNQAQDFEFHTKILQRYLRNSTVFDGTAFSATNPNTFSRVPWPVFPRLDGTRFKTAREINVILKNAVRRFHEDRFRANRPIISSIRNVGVILKNAVRRFHEDRFRANRPIISSIRNVGDREVVIQPAKIVVQTINAGRSI